MQQSASRPPPLHQWDIPDASHLPLQESKRKMTDVICIILGVLFGLVLFIIAVCVYSRPNLKRASYPVDSKGVVCQIDAVKQGKQYPFLYFDDISNPNNGRHCVSDCPQPGVPIQCFDDCSVGYYPNYPSSATMGALCLPEDENSKNQLLTNANIDYLYNSVKALSYLLLGVGIAFGLSLIWFGLAHFLPKIAVWLAIILAAVLLLLTAIIFFIASSTHLAQGKGWAIALGVICVLLMLLLVFYACFHRTQIKVCAAFLQVATNVVKEKCGIILLTIIVFVALTFLFGILTVFQYLAFSSSGQPTIQPNDIYYKNSRKGFLIFLLVVQTLWGLSFLRDSFNYIISAIACNYYFKVDTNQVEGNPAGCCPILKRLICKNIGSVIGGSLLSALFYFPSLLISFIAPKVDCCLCNFFDIDRSDTYAYIYLTGNSYCPSSRHAHYLSARSRICRQNESAMAIYAFAGRIVIALSSILIIYWITRDNLVGEKVPPYLLLGIFFMCLYIVSYFVDVHVHAAQALLVCFHTQYDLEKEWSFNQMRQCPQELVSIITDLDREVTEKSYKPENRPLH